MYKDLFGYGAFKSGGKNRCVFCGCILEDNERDTCEICFDELYEIESDEPEKEERLWSKENPALKRGGIR
jgi:hypothetical protein